MRGRRYDTLDRQEISIITTLLPHGADASWGLFFTSLSRHRDAEKLHKGFIVYCSVKLKPINKQVAEQFCEVIRGVSEVTECYNISGQFDYLLKVHAPDMKYYQQLVLDVLGQLPMLSSQESTFVMEEIKNDFGVAI